MVLYPARDYLNLPYNVNEFIHFEFGTTLGQRYIVWGFIISLFVSSIILLIGFSTQKSKWYWPSLIVNTVMIARYAEVQIAYSLDFKQLSPYFWIYFSFIVIDTYLTLMIYKGKAWVDWIHMERSHSERINELLQDTATNQEYHYNRQQQHNPTAPTMSDNDYYVLH